MTRLSPRVAGPAPASPPPPVPSGASRSPRCGGHGGQATILAVLVLAVAIGAGALAVAVGSTAIDRAQARSAADAAALAAAAEGTRRAAQEAATRDGGVLESYRIVDGQTEVTVRVRRARATARAVVGPIGPSG